MAIETKSCPLCGEDRPKKLKRAKSLYGHMICKKCSIKFVNRRQIAWAIDFIVIRVLVIAIFVPYFMIAPGETDDWTLGENLVFYGLLTGLFLIKDGFSGYSLGKLITGVRVVDQRSGEPAGILRSIQRNLIVLVPFMPIVIGLSLGSGPRLGDGWAKTRVVWWRRYRTNMVFSAPEAVAKVFD